MRRKNGLISTMLLFALVLLPFGALADDPPSGTDPDTDGGGEMDEEGTPILSMVCPVPGLDPVILTKDTLIWIIAEATD